MRCAHCAFENEPDAKFCENCGQPLAHTCPNCGKAVSQTARFCRNCGFALRSDVPAPRETPTALEPRARPEPPRSEPARDGERRVVTVLFCDVKGSTAMAERLDPEEWADIMNRAFSYLIKPVYRYEGTVARLMGDAILAFFGAPIAHEDDPQRAVMAGLEIIQSVQPYRAQLQRERGLDFNLRVGINTGLVVVGAVGSEQKLEYTAMGDAVNVAARMEQTAQPGTVQIAHDTYRLIAPLFEIEFLEGIEVKGKREPVRAYRVLRPKAEPGRLRGIEGLNAPLIGRDQQFAQLKQSLSDLREGRGQIVCLMGEAGLGKSRLVRELRETWIISRAPEQHAHWSESRALSYDKHPYFQFQQHIRNIIGISESDAPERVREQLVHTFTTLPADQRQRAVTLYEMLLAVEDERDAERASARLEGEAFKRELFDLSLQGWRAVAAQAPTVLVFDDLHWADAASLELLRHLFPLTQEVPLLLICAFRPDRQAPSWAIKQAVEADYPHRSQLITLAPLSNADSNVLVDSLLTISDLPNALRQRILERADGNPFFVEEVVRTLIDKGVVVRDETGTHWRAISDGAQIEIPENLQALLVARIDRLEEDARYTLQLASVIGRTFYYRVLKMLADVEAELEQQLTTLQKVDLIREAARVPELEFAFRHALTQEAVYNSILLKRRRAFHLRVGETLESVFADRLEQHAETLAHHFDEAQDPRAQKYHTLAGDTAFRLYANNEAAAHYTRALQLATADPQSERKTLEYLYERRGRALELLAQFEEARENYAAMRTLARQRKDRALEMAALMSLATLHSVMNPTHDIPMARALSEEALSIAAELGNREAESKILWTLSLLGTMSGDPHEGVRFGEQSLAIARELNLREQLAHTLNDLYYSYIPLGKNVEGEATLREAQELWRELKNMPMLVDSLTSLALLKIISGRLGEARPFAEEAVRIAQSSNNLWGYSYAGTPLGYAHVEAGEYRHGLHAWQEALNSALKVGGLGMQVAVGSELGWHYASLGAVDHGMQIAARAHQTALNEFPGWQWWAGSRLALIHVLRGERDEAAALFASGPDLQSIQPAFAFPAFALGCAKAELALARGDPEAAVRAADDLYAYMLKTNIVHGRAEILLSKGTALVQLGQHAQAAALLQQARAIAEETGSRRVLWQVLFALSELAAEQGHTDDAPALRQQAREHVAFIAEQLGQSSPALDNALDLRALFLAKPEVRALLGAEYAQANSFESRTAGGNR